MTSPNFSIISYIFRPAQTSEYRNVGPNRRKYRKLSFFTSLNGNADFRRKSPSFSEIFSESLTKGMRHNLSKFQHHNVNISYLGDF